MELIQTVTVGSGGASSITFSSIPATYDDLQVVFSLRNTGTSNVVTRLQFNADTASNYSSRLLYGTGSSAASFAETRDSFYIGNHPASSNTGNTFGSQAIYIPNYRSGVAKSVSADTVEENNATASWQQISAHLWTGTAAITSMRIYPDSGNWVEGSSASLYGIRKFNTSAQPKATGGAISFDAVNNKWVHVFSTSGTFTPTANITCEYLVVAGGGSGGCGAGGGGGAGGYRSSVAGQASGGGASAESPLSLTSGTNYTVTIGAGGASRSGSDANGFSGSNSVFGSITATGGGAGAGFSGPGISGGSGGGASYNGTGGAGTANQGFAGAGAGSDSGGGGGAGAVGSARNGGNGVASTVTGTYITRAGGGGGYIGSGGTGGGGAGGVSSSVAATSGTMNTGSGGGGSNGGQATGAGGSGIVIVRYDA